MSVNIFANLFFSLFAVSAGLDLDKVADWALQPVLLFLLPAAGWAGLLLDIAEMTARITKAHAPSMLTNLLWNSRTPQTIICFTFCHQPHDLALNGWCCLCRDAAMTFSSARLRFGKYFYVSKMFGSVTQAAIFIAVMITSDWWAVSS